jgi:ribose transport system substrate-binding protein
MDAPSQTQTLGSRRMLLFRRFIIISTALAAATVLGAMALLQPPAPGSGKAAPGSPPLSIVVIPKGTTHVFWKSVEAGAKKAGEDLGVQVTWKGPLQENDRAQQIQIVQQFMSQDVNGIVLAPLDHTAMAGPVKAAAAKKIPVVIFDSALDGEAGKDFVSFVATDGQKAGRMGGEHLAKLMQGKGNVVLLRYMAGSASTDARETGFLDAVKTIKDGSIKVTVDNRYAGPTSGEAKTAALNMIDQIKAAGGVFCPNESSTYGMLLALRQAGLVGKVKFVGFDASPPLVDALRKGEIDALVVQDPKNMGYRAVEALVKHIRGEKVEPRIDTGAVLVTHDNMDTPEIKRLID